MQVNKIEYEYFTDNMVIYIKRITEKFNYNSIIMSLKI